MNSVTVALISIILFVAGYRFYSSRLVSLFGISNEEVTPAHKNFDGIDYVPAKNWIILFGHHFSSIAGAAPVIGPVLALSIWGWGPAVLWIILGSIFIGGVHDFGSLAVSIKKDGRSIADVTAEVISYRAKLVFASFVWLTLILVIAVFVYLCAKTLTFEPRIVIPSVGLIAVALVIGYLLYNREVNHLLVTLLGFGTIFLLILFGNKVPISIPVGNPQLVWGYILLVYCFFASITPVHVLLQPRDYLSAYLLVVGVLVGYAGIFIAHPKITIPFFTGWHMEHSAMWPMLFVTVACGAISGFHSLVASGTTSKQIAEARHCRRIGYGAMLAEGAVAVLAVLAVGAGLSGEARLSELLGEGGSGPVGAFGQGYGSITFSLLGGFGGIFAIVVLNSFILTTLDTATRIGRYLTHELFGIKNRYIATLIVVLLSGWLGLSGNWSKIWPIFGAANQLVAALALLVITMWLLSRKSNIMYTAIPCAFMLLTTIGALLYKVPKYFSSKDILLAAVSIVLLVLACYMLLAVLLYMKRRGFTKR